MMGWLPGSEQQAASGGAVRLRPVEDDDLDAFFEHQLDPEANRMAAFGAADPTDRAAFDAKWARIRADARALTRTVLVGDDVAGYASTWDGEGGRYVGYWLAREHWGRGVATRALALLVDEEACRPLMAYVVSDNAPSRRVLEKCGFRAIGQEEGFSASRGADVVEILMSLDR